MIQNLRRKTMSNADFVPLIIVVFLIMISNFPCKNIHFYRMLQVLRRLFALFSANLRRIAEKRIGKGIMQELLMHSVKPPEMQYKITVEYLVLRINKFSLKAKYFLP